eukprot:scaffold467595_cov25-Prasinocladus_malaysianus.AAC.1
MHWCADPHPGQGVCGQHRGGPGAGAGLPVHEAEGGPPAVHRAAAPQHAVAGAGQPGQALGHAAPK